MRIMININHSKNKPQYSSNRLLIWDPTVPVQKTTGEHLFTVKAVKISQLHLHKIASLWAPAFLLQTDSGEVGVFR